MLDADDWESFDFYTENRGLRQTLWDFILYQDVPPDAFDELWNIEERWESQKWFKHHLRVLEDIDQESKSALNEDDLIRILQFNEKLDNEAFLYYVFNVTNLDWDRDGHMNLMEMVDLNNVMRSYYWRDDYDSRGTYKYWNVRTQRAFFGVDVRVTKYIGPDRLVKYYKPEMHSVMAEALCDEFLMTYDKDEDDFVPIDDFTQVLTARASERSSSDQKYFEKELEKFRMYDIDNNDIVSWQEILDHHREVLKNPKKPFQNRINQLIEKCDTNKNMALDQSELSNLDCSRYLEASDFTFLGRWKYFTPSMMFNKSGDLDVSSADLRTFHHPINLATAERTAEVIQTAKKRSMNNQ